MEVRTDCYGSHCIVFSTGREVSCEYGGVIGINIDGRASTYVGHDDEMYDNEFSDEERIELADFMIGLWTKYKNEQTEQASQNDQ